MKKEKETLALNYEQEEECLTNDLSRKLTQVGINQIDLSQVSNLIWTFKIILFLFWFKIWIKRLTNKMIENKINQLISYDEISFSQNVFKNLYLNYVKVIKVFLSSFRIIINLFLNGCIYTGSEDVFF